LTVRKFSVEERLERLHSRVQLGRFFEDVANHPEFVKFFDDYETEAMAEFLELKPGEHDARLAVQYAIRTIRSLRNWIVLGAQQGRQAAQKIAEEDKQNARSNRFSA
jgi:hypothetical protein